VSQPRQSGTGAHEARAGNFTIEIGDPAETNTTANTQDSLAHLQPAIGAYSLRFMLSGIKRAYQQGSRDMRNVGSILRLADS